ncbi:cation transport protein-domain-containing protein [Colletotrichum navitas]|uniref:Potassium transport protein n=1 Tax=Colletotrichum navitas TaxID=681940 RepID=A0AAD8PLJ2_9PEZI|nr:cation transport protein-domain-containing protein [Colletotrichum navitas]KAK1569915.1 cation transport protein-domain-containing protein [Colletotrichum navitas]
MHLNDSLKRLFSRSSTSLGKYLPPLNFITLHYVYFIVMCLISSVIFWGSSDPAFKVSYTDSLFLVVSAMTEAGMNTVNLSQLTTWQQTILFLLLLLGSTIWVSIWTVLARKHVFENRFNEIVRAERARKLSRQGSSLSLAMPRLPLNLPKFHLTLSFGKAQTEPNAADIAPYFRRTTSMPNIESRDKNTNKDVDEVLESQNPGHITFDDTPHPNAAADHAASTGVSLHDDGAPRPSRRVNIESATDSADVDLDARHFLKYHLASRNGQFHGLSSAERDHLGGCEYRALKVLALLVPVYFFLWQILGCLGLGAWMNHYMPDTAKANGINPWWLGIFNGVSAFNNSGMSLLDANLIPFQGAYYVLITMGLLILAGNTAYPLFLRLILWSSLRLLNLATPQDAFTELKATLEFILKYPRRVYTNLFPSRPTWWLFFMLLCLNCVDWVAFEILNLGNPVIERIPTGFRVLDGLFQALAVRSGGFYVVPISGLFIGLQLLYVIMMYISVYPVVITMRHSNVYEERSLGIYSDDVSSPSEEDPEGAMSLLSIGSRPPTLARTTSFGGASARPSVLARRLSRRISFISQQVRGQLAHDLWWLVLAVLIITIIETSKFNQDPVTFSVFNIIFEVVSAYGTVGISVGIPTDAYSFCGAWHTGSKLILCLVMLRGRHRGLPVALDHAVRLPGRHLHHEEEEDHQIRRSRTLNLER